MINMQRMIRIVSRILFYYCARFLPVSYEPFGFIGKRLRYLICKQIFIKCGEGANIERGAHFGSGNNIELGRRSGIGINASLSGKVTIGDNVMMGPDVLILTANHNFDRIDMPMITQGLKEMKAVTIGNDVWIGARVIILPGVTIGNGVVIGAGAVIAKDIPDWAIVVGNPSKIIRFRIP